MTRHLACTRPKLIAGNALFDATTALLRQHWSPQQIASHLAQLHATEAAKRVSHDTIWNVCCAQLRKESVACMRMARARHWPRAKGEDWRGQPADLLSIHVRPPEMADRQSPGHREGT